MEIFVSDGEGNENPVPVEALKLPEGYEIVSKDDYVPRESVRENYVSKASFDRRFKNWTPLDKAHENEEVVSRVLAEHNPAKELEGYQKQWEEAKVKPLQNKLQDLTGRLKQKEISAEAANVFAEPFVKSPGQGIPSWSETALERFFAFDEESGYTVAVDDRGNPIPATEPTSTRPWMGVRERMAQFAKDEAFKGYLKEPPKNDSGSGFAQDRKGQSGVKRRSDFKSDAERAAFISANGSAAYLAMPE